MTGPAVTFALQPNLDAFAASVEAALGYPKDDQRNIGGGIHPPHAISPRYGEKIKHPTLSTVAYHPWDAKAQSSGVAVPVSGTVATLDATWDGAAILSSEVP
jgi:hypothetical protein